MIRRNEITKNSARSRFASLLPVVLLLCLALAATSANAQTTTTLFAGTQDPFTFGLADVTLPGPGIILPGTAINPATGHPVRHLWYGDDLQGLCRLDPDLDSAGTAPGPGLGAHATNFATCVGGVGSAILFSAGQMAFDPATNTLYVTDTSLHTNLGLLRMHYVPSGDNGQGTIDPASIQRLVSPATNVPTCLPPNDPALGGNSAGTQADAAAIGPDGNLYFGYLKGGQVVRVLNAATLDPSVNGACQNNVQVPIVGPDEGNGTLRPNTQGTNFGMAWIGHTLFSGNATSPWELTTADQCLTAANGNRVCGPAGANAPLQILAATVGAPQSGVTGDGTNLYFATFGSVTKIANAGDPVNLTAISNYGGSFCFISGIAVDVADPQQALYVGVDCAQGGIPDGGAIYKVVPGPVVPVTDLTLSLSAPGNVSQNSTITYTMKVSNVGNQHVPQAVLTDNLPANAVGGQFTTSQGACNSNVANLICNLGDIAPGASATVTFTATAGTTTVTNSASVADFDATGNPITDATPANNTASATTTVTPPVQTDIQVTGAAQNGGPNAGSIDTYTWQIKNNQGTVNAPNVVFTNVLPSNLQFATASSTIGSCSTPPDGAAGGTVTCSAASLPGGQTMVVTVNVIVTQAATIATTGSATFQGTDTNPNNNSFTVTIKSK